ncbi:YceI family protein [Pseudonocardia humida]|uniref:YceI family protein n=1 Tax=Pseudonocardia humida TaxID=2800819 RepID=A0ABT1AA88_9PSEU|nr:YceI family protein [Pseudonocardia humida]MCO1659932.1 YceI family protein [Pseudonocardia humida]
MTVEATTTTFRTGTWSIDPVHSSVSFTARHLGVAKVRGTFDAFEGTVTTAADPRRSSVVATIRTASVNTRNSQRDGHLRSRDFLDVAAYPTMAFRSTAIRPRDGETVLVDGELTLRGVTRPVTLAVEVGGFADGPNGSTVAGFSATTEIDRTDFGVTGGPAGAIVSDRIRIALEIEATLTA